MSEIQQLTPNCTWRHVKSADNPADHLSRGLTSQELINSSVWWNGLKFLQSQNFDLTELETPITLKHIPETIPEQRKTIMLTQPSSCNFWQDMFSKFSSFSRLKRSFAFCQRFVHNLTNKNDKLKGPLSVAEPKTSEFFIIKKVQEFSFCKERSELRSQKIISNRHILHLSPFIDTPILLPSKNKLVSLMLKLEHIRLGHSGAQNVLSNFKLRYWPLGGLKEIKRIIKNCHTCFRFKATTAQQIMADLPLDRVRVARPFSKVGVDFGGPFLIKSSKNPGIEVFYGCFCVPRDKGSAYRTRV